MNLGRKTLRSSQAEPEGSDGYDTAWLIQLRRGPSRNFLAHDPLKPAHIIPDGNLKSRKTLGPRQGVRYLKNLDVDPLDGLVTGSPTKLGMWLLKQ